MTVLPGGRAAANSVDDRTKQLQAPTSAVIARTSQSPVDDIRRERERGTVNVQAICEVINGGKVPTANRMDSQPPPKNPPLRAIPPSHPSTSRLTCVPCPTLPQDALERRRYLSILLQQQPWANKYRRFFHSRTETYVAALDAAFQIQKLVQQHRLSADDYLTLRTLLDFPGGLELHLGMYIPTLQANCTEEQKKLFLK